MTSNDIWSLNDEIEQIKKTRNRSLEKAKTIKTISICCLALLGYFSLDILFLVLGGLILAYKPAYHKKTTLQWVAGFLCILPEILIIIGVTLGYIQEYVYSDELYDYYERPYYYEGLGLIITGQVLFYIGAIVSLVFISNSIHKTHEISDEKINEVNRRIRQIDQE